MKTVVKPLPNRKLNINYYCLLLSSTVVLVNIAIHADCKHNSSECGISMKFCIIVIKVMEIVISYGPKLKIEICGNRSHIKNSGRWISIKYFKMSYQL